MIKLIASDLDGTLLDNNGYSKRVWKYYRSTKFKKY